jgi:UDP-N-acetyl-D-glucosamine dehydrogenase
MRLENELGDRITSGEAKLCVVGLGYVGLPLAILLSTRYRVVGYDQDSDRIKQLAGGSSYIIDISDDEIGKIVDSGMFTPTDDEKVLEDCQVFFICVPTPLNEEKYPNLHYVEMSCELISKYLKKGDLVVLESTTYPGTTDDVVVPLLERSGLKAGEDFFAAFSPERVDPGSKNYKIVNTPKIVGGITPASTDLAYEVYNSVIEADVIKVSNCKVAEASKILENIFRGVNIALVNEMALVFERMGIDTWEVINAASTKPFSFLTHYPGPGVGGHCIPLDPYYLSYEARKFGMIPHFIELSGEINEFMKIHTVNKVREGLKRTDKKISDAKVVVMGLAYKKDISDTRESPAVTIIEELNRAGAEIAVHDPHAKGINTRLGRFESSEPSFDDADCLVFVTDHTEYKSIPMEKLRGKVIVDCRNLFDSVDMKETVYLCLGKPSE